jgi:hypothetical protein
VLSLSTVDLGCCAWLISVEGEWHGAWKLPLFRCLSARLQGTCHGEKNAVAGIDTQKVSVRRFSARPETSVKLEESSFQRMPESSNSWISLDSGIHRDDVNIQEHLLLEGLLLCFDD